MAVTIENNGFILSGHMPGQGADRPDKSFGRNVDLVL